MAKLKELLSQTFPRNDSAHATMQILIGGYLLYLAYGMVQDTISGASGMYMTVTVILAGIMALCGLGVIALGIRSWRAAEQAKTEPKEETEEQV